MLKALAIKGMVSAGQLLNQRNGVTRSSQVMVRKLGTQVTASGRIKVVNSRVKRKSRPGKRIRAKAYAANVQKTTCPETVMAAILTLLQKYRPKFASFQARGKLSHRGVEGMKTRPLEASVRFINETLMEKRKGTMATTAPKMRMM